MPDRITCRSCGGTDLHGVLSLGKLPLPDALVHPDQADQPDPRHPLEVMFCRQCTLVQLADDVPPEVMFVDNYLYFSSFATALLDHARRHAERLIEQQRLDGDSLVVELASNDGYLLRNFVEHGISSIGIDPAPDQAAAAREAGVETIEAFFGLDLARELRGRRGPADVIVANNVMAHVPDLNDFVGGMAHLLAEDGVITVENPYVRDLVQQVQFDTIYHEHYCYFSCTAVDHLARRHGLWLNQIDHFPSLHGGTLRWTLGRRPDPDPSVTRYLEAERTTGMHAVSFYDGFAERVAGVIDRLQDLIHGLRAQGHTVAAYGAAAKGTMLLNAAGLGPDLVTFVVDRNDHKQGRLMPGTRQPILDPAVLLEDPPDYLLILAWNFAEEIITQQAAYHDMGGRFIVPIPVPEVLA